MDDELKEQDPATGIQPFLPPQPPSSPPVLAILLAPLCILSSAVRAVLLSAIALIHVLLVEGVCLALTPLPPIHRLVTGYITAFTCRLALGVMGFYCIKAEMASPKRGTHGIAQTIRQPQKGDLILSNWTSYVDVLYLAFRYNPVFLLPTFSSLPSPPSSSPSTPASTSSSTRGLTGRHTGTGSANIAQTQSQVPQPDFLGYQRIPLLSLLARTGSLPPTFATSPAAGNGTGFYKTIADARKKEGRVVCVLPEGTTSNGRAVLRLPDGVLGEEEFGRKGDDGIVWINFIRHSAPTSSEPTSTCPLPIPLTHLLLSLLYTPPTAVRALTVRTLHPSNSPSSPSFLPSEIIANAPGSSSSMGATGQSQGLQGMDKDSVWREAVATVMSETGRSRRVRGMAWVEKAGFLEFYGKRKGRR